MRHGPACAAKAVHRCGTLAAMHIDTVRILAVLAAGWLAGAPALAQGLRPSGYFVQAGVAKHDVWNATAGVTWPWSWRSNALGGELGGLTESYVSHWNAPGADGGRHGFTQVGVVPVLRLRFDHGRSPWFAEGGIGVSVMDRRFVKPTRHFSTSFNFVDVIGVGRSFAPDRRQELSLRLQHVSNGGSRRPNPGQDFFQLRYAAMF